MDNRWLESQNVVFALMQQVFSLADHECEHGHMAHDRNHEGCPHPGCRNHSTVIQAQKYRSFRPACPYDCGLQPPGAEYCEECGASLYQLMPTKGPNR